MSDEISFCIGDACRLSTSTLWPLCANAINYRRSNVNVCNLEEKKTGFLRMFDIPPFPSLSFLFGRLPPGARGIFTVGVARGLSSSLSARCPASPSASLGPSPSRTCRPSGPTWRRSSGRPGRRPDAWRQTSTWRSGRRTATRSVNCCRLLHLKATSLSLSPYYYISQQIFVIGHYKDQVGGFKLILIGYSE